MSVEQETSLVCGKKGEIVVREKNLLNDVATEMSRGFGIIEDIVDKLAMDTKTTVDEEGNSKTYVNPYLLPWVRERRMLLKDIWKLSGGEIEQEKEKEMLKIKGKMIIEAIGSLKPDELKEKMEQWKATQRKS